MKFYTPHETKYIGRPIIMEPVLFTQLNVRALGESKPSTILPLYDVVLVQNNVIESGCYNAIINQIKYN